MKVIDSVTSLGIFAAVAEDERQVLGAVLLDPEVALPLARAEGLQAEHFGDDGHRLLWQAIESIERQRKPVGFVTVFEALQAAGHVERVGGSAYINRLCVEVESTRAAGVHAAVVLDRARRRAYLQAADELRAAATVDTSPARLLELVRPIRDRLESAEPRVDRAEAFRAVPVADLADIQPLAPTYAWRGWLPQGHVTVLSGHGGVGKSLIAGMLTVRIGVGGELFGVPVQRQRVAFFSGEDGADLLRHRLLWICQGLDVDPADLDGWVHILDATEGDPTLFAEVALDGRRVGTTTATYGALARYLDEHDIGMLIVDNMSDTFDANEIERPRVRAFMRALMQLRKDRRLTVLLLAHVDKGTARGERVGSESYSGSTALHNSARSRIFVWKDKDGALVIEHQKHNLGPLQQPLRLDWPVGGLPRAQEAPNGYVQAIAATADLKALLRLIAEFGARGEYVAAGMTSPASAPRLLAGERGYPKARKPAEVQAMLRDAERDGLLMRVTYRGRDRHERERWELTGAGQVLIGQPAGSAGSAGSAVLS